MPATASVMPLLELLRDQLATVPDVQTCRIGMEPAVTPDDYPLVRLVPTGIQNAMVLGRRRVELDVVFGLPVHESAVGLEQLHTQFLAFEAALIDAALTGSGYFCEYRETVLDGDENAAFKLGALRVRLEG